MQTSASPVPFSLPPSPGSLLTQRPALLAALAPHAAIFARMSPQQKGDVLRACKKTGDFCLMCGDGTNDVAALKQAHCGGRAVPRLSSGVSILSNVALEEKLAAEEAKIAANSAMEEETSPVMKVRKSGEFQSDDGAFGGWSPPAAAATRGRKSGFFGQ